MIDTPPVAVSQSSSVEGSVRLRGGVEANCFPGSELPQQRLLCYTSRYSFLDSGGRRRCQQIPSSFPRSRSSEGLPLVVALRTNRGGGECSCDSRVEGPQPESRTGLGHLRACSFCLSRSRLPCCGSGSPAVADMHLLGLVVQSASAVETSW